MAEISVFADMKLAEKFLERLKSKAKDIEDASQKTQRILSPIVFKNVIEHFQGEEGPSGPWDEWSGVYAAHMERMGKGGNKILQDSGKLRQSFRPQNVRRVSQGLLWFNPAKTSTGFPYAYAHDEGGPKLPARPFMWLSKTGLENIAIAITKWLDSKD